MFAADREAIQKPQGWDFLVSKLTHVIFLLQKEAPYMAHVWLF